MSEPRFAPMTAMLLARKGTAAPSQVFSGFNGAGLGDLSAAAHATAPPVLRLASVAADAEPIHDPEPPKTRRDADHPHKVRVSLSDAEFEKFGIAAVKRGTTRHQLLREALNSYVNRLMRDFDDSCPCLGGTPTANGCCRD